MKNNKHKRYETGEWRQDCIKAWWAWVYVGGDLQASEMACRKLAFPSGMCVTIKPVKYIFAGSTEDGVQIGLIQYPPFPENETDMLDKAIKIGREVAETNHQWSYSIVTPTENLFFSRRRK
jgi:hypothetical protein